MKYLKFDISFLKLEDSINKIFKMNNILVINDLWLLTRDDLKKIGLNGNLIKKVVVKLQLIGLDLNKKKY